MPESDDISWCNIHPDLKKADILRQGRLTDFLNKKEQSATVCGALLDIVVCSGLLMSFVERPELKEFVETCREHREPDFLVVKYFVIWFSIDHKRSWQRRGII